MAFRRSQPILRLLCLGVLALGLQQMWGLAFVGPAHCRGLRARSVSSKAEAEPQEQPPAVDDEKVFDDWFDTTDATSGGVFWLWLLPVSAVLFYVYLDLIYGEKCVNQYLNASGAFCYQTELPSALSKLASA